MVCVLLLMSVFIAFAGDEKEEPMKETPTKEVGPSEKELIRIGAIVRYTGEVAEMGIESHHALVVAEDLLNAKG